MNCGQELWYCKFSSVVVIHISREVSFYQNSIMTEEMLENQLLGSSNLALSTAEPHLRVMVVIDGGPNSHEVGSCNKQHRDMQQRV